MSLPGIFYIKQHGDILRLSGRDRQSFLQGMVTNNVGVLTAGQGCYAFHLTSKGQVVADLHVLCLVDSLVLVTEPGWGEPLTASLEHHLVMERVRLQTTSHQERILVSGPAAGSWIVGLGFADAAAWTEGANALDEALGLAYRSALGYVFLDDSAILEAALRSHNVVQFDSAVLAGMRIERGIPLGRVDFDEKTLALEIGQTSRAIHFKKGCYLGQEVVARIDARGHTNRGLVGFTSARVLTPGSRALSDGKDVGWITSSAIGPTRGTPVALGYLRHESAVAKTEVQVGGESAQVIALPFVGAMS